MAEHCPGMSEDPDVNPSTTTGQQPQSNLKMGKGHKQAFLPRTNLQRHGQKHISSTHKKRQISHVRCCASPTERLLSERQQHQALSRTRGAWTFLYCCGASSYGPLGNTVWPSFKRMSTPRYTSAAIQDTTTQKPTPIAHRAALHRNNTIPVN